MAPATTTVTRATAKRKAAGANGKATVNGHVAGKDADSTKEVQLDAVEEKYKDFFWTYTEEPHRTRRLAIIKAHPEVGSPLFGDVRR